MEQENVATEEVVNIIVDRIMAKEQESLIKEALLAVVRKGGRSKKRRYAKLALDKLDSFESVQNTVDKTALLHLQNAPEDLNQQEGEEYAKFIHHLFKDGDLFGMAHEDPMAVLVLTTSAVNTLQQAVVDGKEEFIPKILDLMLLQGISQFRVGGHDIAKALFISLLNLTLEKKEDIPEFLQGVKVREWQEEVLTRAAPSAMMLAELLHNERDIIRARAALSLAEEMFDRVIQERRRSTSRLELLVSLLAMAEIHAHNARKTDCTDTLDLAINYIESDYKTKGLKAPYLFVASVIYQKRAEMYAMENNTLDNSLTHFDKAIEFAELSTKASPTNFHYQDHYTEVLNRAGVAYGIHGDVIKAQNLLLQGVEIRREMIKYSKQYVPGMAALSNNLAQVLLKYGNIDAGYLYMKEALDILKDLDPTQNSEMSQLQDALEEAIDDIRNTKKVWKYNMPARGKSKDYGPN